MARLLAWDDRGRGILHPVAIQSELGARLLTTVTPVRRLMSAHVVGSDGVVHSGADGAAILADVLPVGAPLALFARSVPWLVRGVYGAVAAHRTRVSRLVPAAVKRRADAELRRRASRAHH